MKSADLKKKLEQMKGKQKRTPENSLKRAWRTVQQSTGIQKKKLIKQFNSSLNPLKEFLTKHQTKLNQLNGKLEQKKEQFKNLSEVSNPKKLSYLRNLSKAFNDISTGKTTVISSDIAKTNEVKALMNYTFFKGGGYSNNKLTLAGRTLKNINEQRKFFGIFLDDQERQSHKERLANDQHFSPAKNINKSQNKGKGRGI
jgi:hypothetical protein